MKIDNLVKVLALVQTSDNKPVTGCESQSSDQSHIDATIALPAPRKVEDEELTMVSTLKRRQSEQEVKNIFYNSMNHRDSSIGCIWYAIQIDFLLRLQVF